MLVLMAMAGWDAGVSLPISKCKYVIKQYNEAAKVTVMWGHASFNMQDEGRHRIWEVALSTGAGQGGHRTPQDTKKIKPRLLSGPQRGGEGSKSYIIITRGNSFCLSC